MKTTGKRNNYTSEPFRNLRVAVLRGEEPRMLRLLSNRWPTGSTDPPQSGTKPRARSSPLDFFLPSVGSSRTDGWFVRPRLESGTRQNTSASRRAPGTAVASEMVPWWGAGSRGPGLESATAGPIRNRSPFGRGLLFSFSLRSHFGV